MIFKAKRDFAKVLFKGEEYEATKVEGDHATFVIDGITYGFSISDNFEQEKPVAEVSKTYQRSDTVFFIAERIKAEYLKHHNSIEDWYKIAAEKIVSTWLSHLKYEPKQDSSVQENADD
jgi:hypothetical protein